MRAVWRRAAAAETATARQRVHIGCFWDIRKAFDAIDRELLAKIAHTVSYPMFALRLSMSMYAGTRFLVHDNVASDHMLLARKGCLAGSKFAGYELKCLMAGMLLPHVGAFADAKLAIHVDDVTLACEGNSVREAVERATSAADTITSIIRGSMLLPLAEDKACVLTNSDSAAQALKAHVSFIGPRLTYVRDLGIDTGCTHDSGVFRSATKTARCKAGRGRNQRRVALARAVGSVRSTAKLYTIGVAPVSGYGNSLCGMSQTEVTSIIANTLAAQGLAAGRGAKLGVSLATAPIKVIATISRLLAGPITAYCEEWLDARVTGNANTLSAKELALMFNAAVGAYDPDAPRRKRVQGPLGAVLEATQRAGWATVSANHWRCARGQDIFLREGSIPMIRSLYGRDIVDAYVARDVKLGPTRGNVTLWRGAMSKILESIKPPDRQRKLLCSYMSGAVATGQKLAAWGYACDGVCKMCDLGAVDSQFHRAWQRPSSAHIRQRHLPQDWAARAQALGLGD